MPITATLLLILVAVVVVGNLLAHAVLWAVAAAYRLFRQVVR